MVMHGSERIKNIGRRQFLWMGVSSGLALAGCQPKVVDSASLSIGTERLFSRMGVKASLDQAEQVAAAGAEFLLISVGKFLMPDQPEAEFEQQLKRAASLPIPVLSCNSFLRGEALRCIGPDAQIEHVMRFAKKTFERARRAGVERIVFGSAGSRKQPEGWSKARTDEAFIDVLKQMGDLAANEGVTVSVENLRVQECNYLTRLAEVGEIVSAVNHPNVRMLADLYHASVMKDSPEELTQYADWIEMVEIAEAKGRKAPGVHGQDFRPYFAALRAGGYQGPIEIEGNWEIVQLPQAFQTIRRQAAGQL